MFPKFRPENITNIFCKAVVIPFFQELIPRSNIFYNYTPISKKNGRYMSNTSISPESHSCHFQGKTYKRNELKTGIQVYRNGVFLFTCTPVIPLTVLPHVYTFKNK